QVRGVSALPGGHRVAADARLSPLRALPAEKVPAATSSGSSHPRPGHLVGPGRRRRRLGHIRLRATRVKTGSSRSWDRVSTTFVARRCSLAERGGKKVEARLYAPPPILQ